MLLNLILFIVAFALFACNDSSSCVSKYDYEIIESYSAMFVDSLTLVDSTKPIKPIEPEHFKSSSSVAINEHKIFERDSFKSSSSKIFENFSSSEFIKSSSSKALLPKKLIGADISKFQEYESYGTKIFDVDGNEKDIFTLLKEHGFNAIRLKTFLNPKAEFGYAAAGCGQDAESFGDKAHVLEYAKKVKAHEFVLLLDIHYSDNWADPNTQIIPSQWRLVTTSDALADSIYAYTYDLLKSLEAVNALPDLVQIGNEITNGMLRDLPTQNTNCWGDNVTLANENVSGVMSTKMGKENTAKYLAAGKRAVKDVSTKIKTVFHIESLGKRSTVDWWMKSIIKDAKVLPDVMGFSAYTAYGDGVPLDWERTFSAISAEYPMLEILIAEYNGGSSKNKYDFDGSRASTHKVMNSLAHGLGAFFWEPASYGEWGAALFDWEGNNLRANPRAFEEYNKFSSK